MGWGPDPIWSTAKVTLNQPACESDLSVSLMVEVPPPTAAEYGVPGQYVQLRRKLTDPAAGEGDEGEDTNKPLFLAIASAPDKENASFEFLVKKTDGNDWLTSIAAGTEVEISQVLGAGYALKENLDSLKYDFPTQNLMLFAAGSGIAPIKAAVESGALMAGSGGRTARLYYGERTAADLCFADKFAKWEKAGIEVVPVLSQPGDDGWMGREGYIQMALEEDGITVPRNSGALLCGMKGMTEAVKDTLLKAGVFEGRILFNF